MLGRFEEIAAEQEDTTPNFRLPADRRVQRHNKRGISLGRRDHLELPRFIIQGHGGDEGHL